MVSAAIKVTKLAISNSTHSPAFQLYKQSIFDPLYRKESMDFTYLSVLINNMGRLSGPLGYIFSLEDNVESLAEVTITLNAKSAEAVARLADEEKGGVQPKKQEMEWLEKVEQFVRETDRLLSEAREPDRIKCFGCLPNCCSYYLAKRIAESLDKAGELVNEGREVDVKTSMLPPPGLKKPMEEKPMEEKPMEEKPMEETMELDISNLQKVWQWVAEDKQGGLIGLHGPHGVGKTTLLKGIKEKLSHTNPGFDVVIWVVLSTQGSEDQIQDAIRERLDIADEDWEGMSSNERVLQLCKYLTQMKFVLMIDDLPGKMELSKIGVPYSCFSNGSKVLFTTRRKQLCEQMKAREISEVLCLTAKEALELFENNVSKSTIHSHVEIPKLAEEVARECKGLPLALITVGRAMVGKENPNEWRRALTKLRENPSKESGMVEEVNHTLEFCYNSLNDFTVQQCFLYCCLFPKNYPIRTDNLIELWIVEGLLEDTGDVYGMRVKGEYVLGRLKMACLLEGGSDDDGRQYVKMNDVIRDMAEWITCDRGKNDNLLVIESEEKMCMYVNMWKEVKKASLWGKSIGCIHETPPVCPQLETLLVRETKVRVVPSGFFDSMEAGLTTLDMSNNKRICSFPKEICKLIRLQYLNLSGTGICGLPKEIENLTCLQWLLLDDTSVQFIIPPGAIASLPLKVFSQWKSYGSTSQSDIIGCGIYSRPGQLNEENITEELESMQHLSDLSIIVSKASSARKIFQSPNLQRGIRRARIDNCQDLIGIIISNSPTGSCGFLHLEVLILDCCAKLEEIKVTQGIGRLPNRSFFPSLTIIKVKGCGLQDLSLLVHAPKLQVLTVHECHLMEKIVGDGFAREELVTSGLFSCLKTLLIDDLPRLTSIYDQTLPFPQLELVSIHNCPLLRKLPLDSKSARGSLCTVQADANWWVDLEWDDDGAKAFLTAKVKSR